MELLADDAPRAVDLEDGGNGQPRDPRPQAAEVVGEPLGEHRERRVGEINARPPGQGLGVEGRAGLDIMGNVGDMDPEEIMPVVQEPDAYGVVEILGLLSVDRDGQPVPVIGPACEVLGGHGRARRVGFGHDLGGELGGQAVTPDDDLRVDAGVVRKAEDGHELMGAPVGLDDLAGAGKDLALDPDGDVLGSHGVEGFQIRGASPFHVNPEDALPLLLQDSKDAAFELPLPLALPDLDLNGVALEGPGRVPGRNEDVPGRAALGGHEPESPENGHQPAADDVRAGRQQVSPPRPANDAFALEPMKGLGQLVLVLAGDPKLPGDILQDQAFPMLLEQGGDPFIQFFHNIFP